MVLKGEALGEIVTMLMTWLSLHTMFPVSDERPEIIFIDQAELAQQACGQPCDIVAWTPYDPPNVIYLSQGMDIEEDVCDQSVLLHEIIHILQQRHEHFAELDKKTRQHRREMEAFIIQNNFLRHHGRRILYSSGFAARFKRMTVPGASSQYC